MWPEGWPVFKKSVKLLYKLWGHSHHPRLESRRGGEVLRGRRGGNGANLSTQAWVAAGRLVPLGKEGRVRKRGVGSATPALVWCIAGGSAFVTAPPWSLLSCRGLHFISFPSFSYAFSSCFFSPFTVSYVVITPVSVFPEAHFLIFKRKLRPQRLVVAAAPDRSAPERRSNRDTPRGNFLLEIVSSCPVSPRATIGKANFSVFYFGLVTFDIDSIYYFFLAKLQERRKRTYL